MAACPELRYSNVSAAAWQRCKAAVSQYVQIGTDQGEASARGVTIRWNYDAARQALSLQCLSKPFIVSCGYVNEQLGKAVKSCLVP